MSKKGLNFKSDGFVLTVRRFKGAKPFKATRKQVQKVVDPSMRAAEVMVKVSGFCKGAGHVRAHLSYLGRHGDEIETDRGEILKDRKDVAEFFSDWESSFKSGRRWVNQRDVMRMVLSMPPDTDPEAVKAATRAFAQKTFGGKHEYVFVLHTNEPHPHCHLAVKCLGEDGKTRLNPGRADLQKWRETFADEMEYEGQAAMATPRCIRGVVQKRDRAAINHIEAGSPTRAPRVSKVRAKQELEAANEVMGKSKRERPWEVAIARQQAEVRKAWSATAILLSRSELPEDKALAKQVRAFIEKMPAPETRHTEAKRRLRRQFASPAGNSGQRLFNDQREKHSVDFNNLDLKECRRRAAALRQPDIATDNPRGPAESIASLRNVSKLDVVRNRKGVEMLLPRDALGSVGGRGAADSGLRRQGVGATSGIGGNGKDDGGRVKPAPATKPPVQDQDR